MSSFSYKGGKGGGKGFTRGSGKGKGFSYVQNVETINKNVVNQLNDTISYLYEQINNREMIIENLTKENQNINQIIHNHSKCFEYIREEKRKLMVLFEKEVDEYQKRYFEEKNKRYEEFYKKQRN
jgi:hypothetical protein